MAKQATSRIADISGMWESKSELRRIVKRARKVLKYVDFTIFQGLNAVFNRQLEQQDSPQARAECVKLLQVIVPRLFWLGDKSHAEEALDIWRRCDPDNNLRSVYSL